MAKYFRCARTGMLYPADYVEQWGRKYGIGLGPVPVSEALVNCYHSPLIHNTTDPSQTMYPVAVCRAQVDLVDIDEPTIDEIAVTALADPNMEVRAEIMRRRQRVNSAEMARLVTRNIAQVN
jgi:hypothetical protein